MKNYLRKLRSEILVLPLVMGGVLLVGGCGHRHSDAIEKPLMQLSTPELRSSSEYSGPTFDESVLPIIKKRCGACHNAKGALANWQDYAIFVANEAKIQNRLIELKNMPPPNVPMEDGERDLISQWFAAGAIKSKPGAKPSVTETIAGKIDPEKTKVTDDKTDSSDQTAINIPSGTTTGKPGATSNPNVPTKTSTTVKEEPKVNQPGKTPENSNNGTPVVTNETKPTENTTKPQEPTETETPVTEPIEQPTEPVVEPPVIPEPTVFFAEVAEKLLANPEKCAMCHNEDSVWDGNPNFADYSVSFLLRNEFNARVFQGKEPVMPMGIELEAADKELLESWLNQGACQEIGKCASDQQPAGDVTFNQVKEVFANNNCAGCHATDEMGAPVIDFTNYAQVVENQASIWQRAVKQVINSMPMGADMSISDRDIIRKWMESDMPE